MIVCKTCGNPENNHPYRHPFIPSVEFNMPKVVSAQEKWDKRFLLLADHISTWSKDPSTKVGAVVVDDKRRVVGVGYNGFPRGVDDAPRLYADRQAKYPRIVHAELNAVLSSAVTEGATLYCTLLPCCECAKAIIQAGIRTLVVPALEGEPDPERWGDSVMIAWEMFEEAGIELRMA